MASSFRVRDGVKSLEDFVTIWHKKFKRRNPNWLASDLYLDGQFDDIPYWIWDENQLIDEFEYHDELVEYNNTNKEK